MANWRKEERRVDLRLLAEDEIAEMGEGGVVRNVGEEGHNRIALTRSLVGRMGETWRGSRTGRQCQIWLWDGSLRETE